MSPAEQLACMAAAWHPTLWTEGALGTAAKARPADPALRYMLRLHAAAAQRSPAVGAASESDLADGRWAEGASALGRCCLAE